ncbi:hypothetical protein [Bosea sp. (in: a-proteobacteria)]|jgi:hypothetical protein|uniref:hypothetical protein n=1 Tax=Bosea sp. (in: a-proteobacteria) TaxID=1871050 RepID=UPI003F6F0338
MIRFRTIAPGEAETPAPRPATLAPSAAEASVGVVAADDSAPRAKPKGLTRKTPLRAKKTEAAPLFDK